MPSASASRVVLPFAASLCLGAVGCGLTLDYDPPSDAGADAPFDAPRLDAPAPFDASDACGGCPEGSVCRAAVCRAVCDAETPCGDTDACEACIDGACVPTDLTCEGGSACLAGACDPATDGCVFEDTCPAGMACSAGTCVPGTCGLDSDCDAIVGGCGFVCEAGTCVPRVPPVCPPIFAASCEVIDPCTCEGTGAVDASLCGSEDVCDEGTFLCVECVGDGDCFAAGRAPRCDPRTHTCVECVHDGDCSAGERCEVGTRTCVGCVENGDCDFPTPACDLLSHACVECLRQTDCDGGEVCDPSTRSCVGCLDDSSCAGATPICDRTTRTCRGCVTGAAGECGIGERCEGGACIAAGCTRPVDCPPLACAGTVMCTTSGGGGGRCTYSGLRPEACDDGVACTIDACDPANATDGSGCTHVPSAGACDDGFSCTLDVCHVSLGPGDPARCEHLPNDAACSSGTTPECARAVCVAHEPGAVLHPATGCGLSYEPFACAPGTYCDAAGRCLSLPSCGLGVGCPPVGSLCLEPLVCVGEQCLQIDDGSAGVCDTLPACATYCSNTGCAPRSGSAVCAPVSIP